MILDTEKKWRERERESESEKTPTIYGGRLDCNSEYIA